MFFSVRYGLLGGEVILLRSLKGIKLPASVWFSIVDVLAEGLKALSNFGSDSEPSFSFEPT